jgi:hypothetical protein
MNFRKEIRVFWDVIVSFVNSCWRFGGSTILRHAVYDLPKEAALTSQKTYICSMTVVITWNIAVLRWLVLKELMLALLGLNLLCHSAISCRYLILLLYDLGRTHTRLTGTSNQWYRALLDGSETPPVVIYTKCWYGVTLGSLNRISTVINLRWTISCSF